MKENINRKSSAKFLYLRLRCSFRQWDISSTGSILPKFHQAISLSFLHRNSGGVEGDLFQFRIFKSSRFALYMWGNLKTQSLFIKHLLINLHDELQRRQCDNSNRICAWSKLDLTNSKMNNKMTTQKISSIQRSSVFASRLVTQRAPSVNISAVAFPGCTSYPEVWKRKKRFLNEKLKPLYVV